MREIDLSADLLPRHRLALRDLTLLAQQVPPERWCLVGGLMVLIAARSEGKKLPRAEQTKDADVLVDVCVHRGSLAQAAGVLTGLGYTNPNDGWRDPDIARCTFVYGRSQIDLLGPDDSDPSELTTPDGASSIAIPGGRRALDTAELTRIYYDIERLDVSLRVPLLPGAIAVKAAAAVDPRTSDERRHIQDVASMLAIVSDPIRVRESLVDSDIKRLAELADRIDDDAGPAWTGIPAEDRRAGQAALRLLLR